MITRAKMQLSLGHCLCSVQGCGHRFSRQLELEVFATEGEFNGQKLDMQDVFVCEMHLDRHQRAMNGENGFYPNYILWADERGEAHLSPGLADLMKMP